MKTKKNKKTISQRYAAFSLIPEGCFTIKELPAPALTYQVEGERANLPKQFSTVSGANFMEKRWMEVFKESDLAECEQIIEMANPSKKTRCSCDCCKK